MKKWILTITILITLVYSSNKLVADGYKISIKIKGIPDTVGYLVHYYGNKFIIRDTAIAKNYTYVFEGDERIKGGIYIMVGQSRNKYFEFIVNEQKFKLITDTMNIIKNMKVVNSKENEVFFKHLIFINDKIKAIAGLQKKVKETKDTVEVNKLNSEIKVHRESINDYQDNLKNMHPNLFFTKLLSVRNEPVPRKKLSNETDSAYGIYIYTFYQLHFFDNMDFSDERMLRTPILEGMIDRYIEKLTVKHPDSLSKAVVRIVEQSRAHDTVFMYVLTKLFNKYVQTDIMGFDAVALELADKYYLSGLTFWTDSARKAKIYEWAVKLSSNLITMPAPMMVMKNIDDDKYIPLYNIKSDYIVIIFWDYTCGTCKKFILALKAAYKKYNRSEMEVYAVYTQKEMDGWRKYVKENKLDTWINVYDPEGNTNNYRITYNVFSTPLIYVIDKERKILAKKIDIKQVEDILNKELNREPGEETMGENEDE